MNRRATFALFLSTLLSVYLGLHFYLGLRLVSALVLPGGWALAAVIALPLAFIFPVSRILSRFVPGRWIRVIDWPASLWIGSAQYLILGSLVAQVVALVLHLHRIFTSYTTSTRRRWQSIPLSSYEAGSPEG